MQALIKDFQRRNPGSYISSTSIPLDVSTYNFLLKHYLDSNDFEAAQNLLKRMEADGISPDPRTKETLFVYYTKNGQTDKAAEVECEAEAGVATYHAFLTHALADEDMERAEGVITRMEKRGSNG